MRTVSRTLQVLDLFSVEKPNLRAAEAADMLALDRATCFRILKSLAARGYVTQDSDTKRYALGPSILRLGQIIEATSSVSSHYMAILTDLTEQVQETTHASIIAGNELASVACCSSPKPTRVHHEIGTKLDWHATASGLTCLAFSPMEFVTSVIPAKMKQHTANTITTLSELAKELTAIRQRGYGIIHGSYDADVTSIAAPVFAASGDIKGAVSIVTPSSRMTLARADEYAQHAIATAQRFTAFHAGAPVII